jgi:hypothetical protein
MRTLIAVCVAMSTLALGCTTADPPQPSVSALQLGCKVDCPKCHPGDPCPLGPYGPCTITCPEGVTRCGENYCAKGETCCSADCGVCMKVDPRLGCPAIKCAPPTTGCTTDADCRLYSDHCTGCDCRALLVTDADPTCSGPGVRCVADPCGGKVAACDVATGRCVAQAGVACGPKTCAVGEACCNKSCGICTAPGGFCTQQMCKAQ